MTDRIPTTIEALPKRSLSPGDTLVEENVGTGGLYFLANGSVEVLKGDVQIAEVSEPGAVFGEMSLLLGTPHTATVRALTTAEFFLVENPNDFLRDNPDVTLYMARILARRLNALNRYLADVKRQFGERDDHLAMLDEVLDTLMHKHPRNVERRDRMGP